MSIDHAICQKLFWLTSAVEGISVRFSPIMDWVASLSKSLNAPSQRSASCVGDEGVAPFVGCGAIQLHRPLLYDQFTRKFAQAGIRLRPKDFISAPGEAQFLVKPRSYRSPARRTSDRNDGQRRPKMKAAARASPVVSRTKVPGSGTGLSISKSAVARLPNKEGSEPPVISK